MAYFQIIYAYDPAQTDMINQVRPRHRAFLSGLKDRGVNIGSGPLEGADPSALLIFQADSVEDVIHLLDKDPFFTTGVIRDRTIRQWNPVIKVF